MSFVERPDNSPNWADDLPEGWTADWVKWSVAFASAKPDGEEIEKLPYISNEDVTSWTGRLLKEDPEPADKEGRLFRRDDVLFNKLRPYLAKVFHADFDGISSGELLNLRASEHVLPRFLFHVLSSFAFIDTVNAETFGTKMPRADWETVGHQPLPLPDIDTQRRIARYLDGKTERIDALIEKKQALLDRLAEKRQALITRTVTRGLNPDAPLKDSGIDWLGKMPAHWDVKKLYRLTDPTRPIRYGIVLPGPNFPDGVPIIKGGDVKPDRLRLDQLNRTDPEIEAGYVRSRMKAGEIVFSIRGSYGDAEIMPEELDGCNLTQDTARVSPNEGIGAHWLLYALKSDVTRLHLQARVLGSTITGVNIFDLRRVPLPVPPADEQEQIGRFLSAATAHLDKTVAKCVLSLEKLQEYRVALVTAAVTGKIKALLTGDASKPAKEAPAAFKRSVLAAYIADTLCDHPSFGRVKFQKLLHLSEAHLGMDDVSGNYYRDAAGPFDTQMMQSVHSQLGKQGWIIAEKRDGGAGWHYRRGDKVDAYTTYFDRYFGDRKEAIDNLLALFAPMTTQQAEIVSTAFAAWNDLLLEGKSPTDGEIVDLILNDWTESKRQIAPERWHAALSWMRDKGLVPRGTGEHTKLKDA